MKKFLSLMLAMIMVMSLVTVGAGATFTDEADINNVEAVGVMNALGILSGSNGAFDPTGTLTRGAAAKIITYMLVGTAKAEAIAAAGLDEKPFEDVPTTSATAPFIAYCAEQGIVGGYSNGKFERSNPVTGNAFIKMVLVALGVKDIDFSAKGWQVEAIARAEDMGLLEGIADDVLFSANLTRENAAQIAFNGMKYVPDGDKYWVVGEVEFDNATDAAMYAAFAGGTPELKTDLTKSLAGKNYKLAMIEEKIVAFTPETVEGLESTIVASYDYPFDPVYDIELDASVSKDLVGHVVNIYFEDKDADGVYDFSETEGESEKVYGFVVLSEEVKVASDKNGMKYTDAAAINAVLGTDYTKAQTTAIYNGTAAADKSDYAVKNYALYNTQDTVLQQKATPTYDGLTIKSGTWIVYDETVIAKKSAPSSVDVYTVTVDEDEYVEVKVGETVVYKTAEDKDDCVAKIVNEVDWVSFVEYYDVPVEVVLTTKTVGEFLTVAEPTVVTGKVTKTDVSGSTDYIYIDGVKTTVNATPTTASTKLAQYDLAADLAGTSFNFDTTYNFYKDADGKVFAYEPADNAIEGTVIVPVKLYAKYDFVEAKTDEYGDPDTDAKTTYDFWMQAAEMNGDIVTLKVSPSYEAVYATEDAAIAGIQAHLTAYDTFTYSTYNTYTVNVDATTGEAVAALTTTVDTDATVELATNAQTLAADLKKITENGKDFYLTQGFKVIYIEGAGSDLKVTVKEGTTKQIVEDAILYGEKADTNDTAYVLKYVVINAQATTGVEGDELLYINTATLSTKVAVPYTDENGKTKTGYNVTAYLNGTKTTILVNAATVNGYAGAGFYEYAVEEDGTYTLTKTTDSVKVKETLTGNYKGLLSVDGLADYDATDAVIVNLLSSSSDYGYDDVPTKASKLEVAGTSVSFIYDADNETIALIYVTAYADQD